ncbi:MAG: N-acetyltransferase, partial [Deltaproteobacteria bacterium]
MDSLAEPYVHPSAVVDDGVELHAGVKIWHFCHVRKKAILEQDVSIGRDVYVDEGVRIGQGSRVQNGVSIFSGVDVAPWCFIGPHVIFTNDAFPRVGKRSWKLVRTRLETGMSIGAGAIIRCGITLGAFSMVGAGAIVTKSVPPFHMAVGFPAECRQMVCACGDTFLPIASSAEEVLRDCCREQLAEDV